MTMITMLPINNEPAQLEQPSITDLPKWLWLAVLISLNLPGCKSILDTAERSCDDYVHRPSLRVQ